MCVCGWGCLFLILFVCCFFVCFLNYIIIKLYSLFVVILGVITDSNRKTCAIQVVFFYLTFSYSVVEG